MRRITIVAIATLFAVRCQVRSVTTPTDNSFVTGGPLMLTVQVLTRSDEQPIAGAAVWENAATVGETDANGISRVTVARGADLHISVTANGYVGFGASGTVNSEETWWFYLEPKR